MKQRGVLIVAGYLLAFVPATYGCDLCAIYSADEFRDRSEGAITLSVSEQFTRYGTLQNDGKKIEGSAEQFLNSSITQFTAAYQFMDEASLQLTLPIVDRVYKRPEEGELVRGNETGLGDLVLTAVYRPYEYKSGDFIFRFKTIFGFKLPTGDASRIKEEADESHQHTAERLQHGVSGAHDEDHHEDGLVSGVHGHDLALGSGSLDYVFGSGIFVESGRTFGSMNLQYALRTEGESEYRYANDLMWEVAVGRFLSLSDQRTIAGKLNLSGEAKGMDRFRGAKASDTGVTTMFVGPEIVATLFGRWSAGLAFDVPVLQDNTDVQLVADHRIRANINYRF